MVTRKSATVWRLPQALMMGAVVATLSACGGGGSTGDASTGAEFVALGDRDVNGDGIVDISFGDVDGDGIEDYDVNGDGNFDVALGLGDFDANNDGLADFDVNDDGVVDLSVPDDQGLLLGFDTDGDGTLDADVNGDPTDTRPTFTEPSAQFPCGSADGDDNVSANNTWTDNCNISRANQFSTSLYTAGIQRIVWCAGFQGDSGATTVDAFTDGVWGNNTQQAVEAFQSARGLVPDGIVGPNTWQALQDELTDDPLSFISGSSGVEPYGVRGDRCSTTALFLNSVSIEGGNFVQGGWQLTQGATNESPVPFSIDNPAGRVD